MASPSSSDTYEGTDRWLPRLLETGEWSDCKIITATKTFNVHRCIVGSKSTVFKAAFDGGFREAETGEMRVEESERVIQELLELMYCVDPSVGPPIVLDGTDASFASEAEHRIDIIVAADKYNVALRVDQFNPCSTISNIKEPEIYMPLWSRVYSNDASNFRRLRASVVDWISGKTSEIMQSEVAWRTLHEDRELWQAVTQLLEERNRPVQGAEEPLESNSPQDGPEDFVETPRGWSESANASAG
ncbi:hypothetical protein BDY17DRAFT_319658 [Neohortaea acidophila]|uniref:BTB domain-containing protein n=1 Tax=Neohortaea acidophila TaxID=245834 RepID=A0A6A6Q4U3_9PEZI|nr:uncharacterized protein BDY17DRAFT_319658 [Neohortaea acidophila]KAF2487091.1 hypothetical protein BDY17DRAFT_319658 [Neohortaea acidophila]